MTIRRKIKRSNVLMAVIPILTTAILVFVSLHTSFGNIWYTWERMYQDENGIQSAQSLIYTYQKELWENNWSDASCPSAGGELKKSEEMNHLEEKLSEMGYHFLIRKNGNEIYSNMAPEDMETAREVAGEAIESAKTLTASRKDVSVIKNTFYHGEKAFSIIAVHCGAEKQETRSYLQRYILSYLIGFVLLFLLLTVCVNWILSFWISRSVLIPLKKLEQGTKEIQEGNLDAEIQYKKPDEFGQVCQNFDEMRKHLKESVEERLQDEKRRKDLIAGVSHDLRTPLTSISGYVDGLLEGIADTPEKQTRYLKAIQTRTRDLYRLVESLSEYNRLENSSFTYQLEETDLGDFVRQYLLSNEEEARQKQVIINLKYPNRPCMVLLDRYEFKRVLDNLFTNTVRYRQKETSVVNLVLEQDSDWAWLCLTDDGPGVPEESLDRIFESFYRVDEARSHAGQGSGIGLAVVKEIIEGHLGSIRAENRNGLAIIIKLPVIKERES